MLKQVAEYMSLLYIVVTQIVMTHVEVYLDYVDVK